MSNLEISNTEDLRKEFLRRANKLCKYNCPYVWGGNGEKTNKMLAVALLDMETSVDNIARIYNYMKKNPPTPYSRIFDCSGLVYYLLRELGLIKSDYNADMFYRKWKCKDIKDIVAGDLLYCIADDGHAYHIGIYAGDNKVIHAKGRDYGVCKTPYSQNPWSKCNSPF